MSLVTVEVDGAVALLRLRRAEKRNAINRTLIEQLRSAVAQLGATESVAAAVLTGDGPSFCGGADVRDLRDLQSDTARTFISGLHECFAAIGAAPQIYIAAINGYALGAGCELAAACDLRLAAEDALLGMPEIRLGIPSVIEAALLARLVGLGRAAEIVYTGATLTAGEAREAGLVNRVAPPERLLDESIVLAKSIAAFSHAALRLQKRVVQSWAREPLDESIRHSIGHFADAFASDEPYRAMRTVFDDQAKR